MSGRGGEESTGRPSSEDVPDFAQLYGRRPGATAPMTPRMAYWLWRTALYLDDVWRDARDDPESLFESLPLIARPFAHGPWLERFTEGFAALAERIGRGESGSEMATCTGEELALHLVIDLAEAQLADGTLRPADAAAAGLPRHRAADRDFERMRTLLFEDSDVLLLFDPSLDGIEDPDNEAAQAERLVNLHPRDWFLPFSPG